MPQLDFTTYSSQIFWFAICFSTLYFCASRIILPRIKAIIENRQNIINLDNSTAKNFENQIQDLNSKTEELRIEASKAYQTKLAEAIKDASTKREEMIEKLKSEIDQKSKASRQEIKDFIENSTAKSEETAQKLAQLIKEKFFGQNNLSKE